MKYKKNGRGFYANHYFILSLSALCLGVEKTILKDLHQFYSLYPPKKPFTLGKELHTKYGKDWPSINRNYSAI